MDFLKVDSVKAAREKLRSSAGHWFAAKETRPFQAASGMILAEDIFSPEDIPAFRRSTVDGYAVIAADTTAASESLPVFLSVKGCVEMGRAADFTLHAGECAEVFTGGMLPEGADAVVMTEYAENFGENAVALYQSAAYAEHTVRPGEEAKAGNLLLNRGRRLSPQDIGVLAAAGITEVPVYRPPHIAIFSTGAELVPPHQKPDPGQVRDINTYALSGLAEKCGYTVVRAKCLPDDEKALTQAICSAIPVNDVVAVSGGSSKGRKDITHAVMDKLLPSGVFTHGIAMKPGKPTILGYDDRSRTLLAGLPGHPVSAMLVFELLFGWLFRALTDCAESPAIPATVACNVAASAGKLTVQPCKLTLSNGAYIAEPVFGKSGLITSLTRADGYFEIPRGAEGLRAGQTIMIKQL